MIMQTGNPALSTAIFSQARRSYTASGSMTVYGTAAKTALMLLLCFLSAGLSWYAFLVQNTAVLNISLYGGMFGGLVLALVTIFKPTAAPMTAPLYSIAQGLFLGAISAALNAAYAGIALQAVCLTFGVLGAMLFLYLTKIVQVTEHFRTGLMAATGGIALVYLASIVLSLFGIHVPFIVGNGLFGILFSIFVVCIAALNLVLDFDFIEKSARSNVPKVMEWYSAFALMVTLIWLYMEVLRLLSKFRSRQ